MRDAFNKAMNKTLILLAQWQEKRRRGEPASSEREAVVLAFQDTFLSVGIEPVRNPDGSWYVERWQVVGNEAMGPIPDKVLEDLVAWGWVR